MIKKSILALIAVAGSLALSPAARADVYAYVDASGVSHFSSRKLDARYSLFSKSPMGAHRVSVTIQPGQANAGVLVAGHTPHARRARASAAVYAAGRAAGRGYGKRYHVVAHARAPLARPVPARYAALVAHTAKKTGVDQALVHAVIQVESHYQPHAVSAKGAAGLMQLMPDTAHRFGVSNRTDPAQNIAGGTRYLKTLLHKFKGNLSLAVAAYNAGEGAVMKYGNRVPPFRETQNYVTSVLSLYHHFNGG